MPTASEFDSYKKAFAGLKKDIEGVDGFLEQSWDDAIKGGQLERTIKGAIEASDWMTKSIKNALLELSYLCQERAGVCQAHDEARAIARNEWNDAYTAWKLFPDEMPWPGSEPDYPPLPATWVTPSDEAVDG